MSLKMEWFFHFGGGVIIILGWGFKRFGALEALSNLRFPFFGFPVMLCL